MGDAEALPLEIHPDDHAEQQLRGVVRVVMPQPFLVHGVLQPGGEALHQSIASVAIQVACFLGKLVRFCGQQLAGGDDRWVAQVAKVFCAKASSASRGVSEVGDSCAVASS